MFEDLTTKQAADLLAQRRYVSQQIGGFVKTAEKADWLKTIFGATGGDGSNATLMALRNAAIGAGVGAGGAGIAELVSQKRYKNYLKRMLRGGIAGGAIGGGATAAYHGLNALGTASAPPDATPDATPSGKPPVDAAGKPLIGGAALGDGATPEQRRYADIMVKVENNTAIPAERREGGRLSWSGAGTLDNKPNYDMAYQLMMPGGVSGAGKGALAGGVGATVVGQGLGSASHEIAERLSRGHSRNNYINRRGTDFQSMARDHVGLRPAGALPGHDKAYAQVREALLENKRPPWMKAKSWDALSDAALQEGRNIPRTNWTKNFGKLGLPNKPGILGRIGSKAKFLGIPGAVAGAYFGSQAGGNSAVGK